MNIRIAAALAAVTLMAPAALVPGAFAQTASTTGRNTPADAFKFLSAKDVTALTDQAGTGPKIAFLADHENSFVEYVTRNDAGNIAEVHMHWTHYIHFLSGAGSLVYGGTVVNPKDTGPGQVRGDSISGGTKIALHPGDFVQIPAGLPHLMNPVAGGKLSYVVFNVRQ